MDGHHAEGRDVLMPSKTPSGQRTQRKPRKLDRAKVVELAEQGLKTADIAKHQGVAPSTIFRFLQQTEPDRQALEAFKKGRGDVFARLSLKSLDLQEKLVDTFDDRLIATLKTHEKGSLIHALNIQSGTLYDKERLEQGQSTSNLTVLGKFILGAEAKLGASQPVDSTPKQVESGTNVREVNRLVPVIFGPYKRAFDHGGVTCPL